MNFYNHHIRDYDAATGHLSWDEDMAYTRLLRLYYRKERPLPADIEATCRLVRAKTAAEQGAVETVLREFFDLQPTGWHKARCDEEIAAYHGKAEVARTNGRLGGRPKKAASADGGESDQFASTPGGKLAPGEDGKEPTSNPAGSYTDPSANPEPTQSKAHQEPITNNQCITPSGVMLPGDKLPPCPHKQILAVFGRHLKMLPQPRPELWGDTQSAEHLRARWKFVLTASDSSGKRYAETAEDAIGWFDRYFSYVASSDFLTGRTGDFKCSLNWLIKSENFSKVLSRQYENKTPLVGYAGGRPKNPVNGATGVAGRIETPYQASQRMRFEEASGISRPDVIDITPSDVGAARPLEVAP